MSLSENTLLSYDDVAMMTELTAKSCESLDILVVDDESGFRQMMDQYFTKLGYVIETAMDGTDAVEKLKKKNFHFVFSDMNMPKMNGMQLLAYVRQHHPDTDVIVITGYGESYEFIDASRLVPLTI